MRNKIICLLFISMIFFFSVFSDDLDVTKSWSELSNVENAWDGQKMITEKEYKKVIDALEKRKNAKKIRAEKKAGNPLMKPSEDGSEADFLTKYQEQYPLLNLSVPVQTPSGIVPVGHYKVIGTKKNGKVYINLCQAYDVIGKIPAIETEDDFNSEEINFVKLEQVKEGTFKIIYGSMKFNAYAYLNY